MVIKERNEPTAGRAGTRERILAAALDLFASRGYAGTSIRDIADRLGLTKAALYYHFASKEEILDAVTEPFEREIRQLFERAAEVPAPGAAELLAGMVDLLSRRGALIRTVLADPSVPPRRHRPGFLEQLRAFAAALAVDASPAAELRARAALGAAQFASFATAMQRAAGDLRSAGVTAPGRGAALLAGSEHLLDPEERAEIVAAALRALRG